MTLYDLTKKYGEGKGEGAMWSTLELVSEALESGMDTKEKNCLIRKVYGLMSDKHYNEEFAREDISKMYYKDEDGKKHFAPYWSDDALRLLFEDYHADIPEYNFWDWAVTMNMTKSDNCPLIMEWFPDADDDERNERIVRLAINWLQDDDNPYGDSKIWCYMNGNK